MKPWPKDGSRAASGDFEDPEEDEVEMSLMSSLKHFTLSDEEEEKKGFFGKVRSRPQCDLLASIGLLILSFPLFCVLTSIVIRPSSHHVDPRLQVPSDHQ